MRLHNETTESKLGRYDEECEGCGKAIQKAGYVDSDGRPYCSMKCHTDTEKRIIINCVNCDLPFTQTIPDVAYCSLECYCADNPEDGDDDDFSGGYPYIEEVSN